MHKELTYLCERVSKQHGIDGFKLARSDLDADFAPRWRAAAFRIKDL